MSHFGKNLNFSITSKSTPLHDWLSFVCWYSISKNLPQSKVCITTKKEINNFNLFSWAYKLKVKVNYKNEKEENDNIIKIHPYTAAVRINNGFLGPTEAKDGEYSSLVSYERGFGKFNYKDWENNNNSPVKYISMFNALDMNINEKELLDLWSKASKIYLSIS